LRDISPNPSSKRGLLSFITFDIRNIFLNPPFDMLRTALRREVFSTSLNVLKITNAPCLSRKG
jgi:hypothetical protein